MPRLSIGLEQVFTNLGIVGSGYKLYFYETGTNTPKTTYSNEGLTIANTNPIVLNAAGRPDVGIWGSDPALYRMVLGTPDSTIATVLLNPIVDVDPVDNYSVNNIAGLTPIPTAYWGATAGTSTHYTLDPALVGITSYSNQQTFFVDFHIACGANPDIDINGLGALNLKKYTGQGIKVGIQEGDLQAQRYTAINDGVDIVILDPRSLPINSGKAPTLTIAGGIVTITNTGSNYLINNEGAAALDTIDTINGGNDGEIAIFSIAETGQVPIFSDGTGNLALNQNRSFVPTALDNSITLQYDGINSVWREIARNSGGIALITQQYNSGTNGGSSTSGSWQRRPLNTEVYDTGNICSVTGNQITLLPGTYRISASQGIWFASPASASSSRIRNITDSATIANGLNQGVTGAVASGFSILSQIPATVFTIADTKTIELQYYTSAALANTGLGLAANSGEAEVYATVSIEKF